MTDDDLTPTSATHDILTWRSTASCGGAQGAMRQVAACWDLRLRGLGTHSEGLGTAFNQACPRQLWWNLADPLGRPHEDPFESVVWWDLRRRGHRVLARARGLR